MTITLTPEIEREIQSEAERQTLSPEQVAMDAMIVGLRSRKVPRTLADLPQRPLPPGKTLLGLFEAFWQEHPSTESEEEVARALVAGLRHQHIPQTLAEITPQNPLLHGTSLREAREALGPWPGDETDAELLDALKSLG